MVSMVFFVAAAALLLAALGFVLPPLLRGGGAATDPRLSALEAALASGVLSDEEYQRKRAELAPADDAPPPPRSRVAAAVLVLLLPLGTWLLYQQVGEPRALQPGAAAPVAAAPHGSGMDGEPQSLDEAAASLAERMQASPDDLGGWMLLGRAYKSLQRFPDAAQALSNAYRLAPENPDVLVEYAEALTLASDSRRLEGQAAILLQQALAMNPEHQRGLWMKGIGHYQDQDFAAAAATWEQLRTLLPPGAGVADALDERIADARSRAGLPAAATEAAATPVVAGAASAPAIDAAGTGSGGTELEVEVDIAPALRATLRPTDVLFVFARAASGPRMPVAIQRLPATELPLTVTLDDSTSMTPQLTLSTLPEVVVGARVSRSGNAAPQPGDLEAFSAPVATAGAGRVRVVIDQVVE